MTHSLPQSTLRPNSLEFWAAARPTTAAIFEEDRVLTWGEWNAASDRLAQALCDRGIQAGDVVGMSCQIRSEWAVLWGALSKLGCRMLGVNWRLTAAEVEFILSNSQAAAFFCDGTSPAALLPAIGSLKLKLRVSIDEAADGFESWASLLSGPAVPRLSAQDASNVVYTSGTTGFPKGVVSRQPQTDEERRNWQEYMASNLGRIPRKDGDVSLVTLPFSHGAGPNFVRCTVAAGNAMVLQRRFDPQDVLRLIERHRVSIWVAVPTMLKRLAALPKAVLDRHDLSSLNTIETGAAPVPRSLKDWVVRTFGSQVLHETYGASELGMVAHLTPEMQAVKPASSGLPLRHVQIRVRDPQGHDLPARQAGELWVRTPMTIRAYLNAPPLDRSVLDEDGFFRIGDVGYVDEDGFIYITDRVKDMIISGGVNIYPAEIEVVLY